jgi:hypothetical protein
MRVRSCPGRTSRHGIGDAITRARKTCQLSSPQEPGELGFGRAAQIEGGADDSRRRLASRARCDSIDLQRGGVRNSGAAEADELLPGSGLPEPVPRKLAGEGRPVLRNAQEEARDAGRPIGLAASAMVASGDRKARLRTMADAGSAAAIEAVAPGVSRQTSLRSRRIPGVAQP